MPNNGRKNRWSHTFQDRLSSRILSGDQELVDVSGHQMGFYRFAEVGEVADAFPNAAWPSAPPCRWVGPLLGFLNFEWWHGHMEFDDRLFFSQVLFGASSGFFARTDTGGWYDPVVEKEFTVNDAVLKHGFLDGDFFLSRACCLEDRAAYEHSVRDAITGELDALGLRGEFISYGTGHNPIRIDQFEPKKGQTYAECWKHFRQHSSRTIRLWGVDWEERGEYLREFLDDDAD